MNEKSPNIRPAWVDPDDAPEITEEDISKAIPMIGERVVTWDEFAQETRKAGLPKSLKGKVPATIFLDADIIEAFKSTGESWHERINDALRAWMKVNLPR
jgi:uncharacterized protein (DUF4415 family)